MKDSKGDDTMKKLISTTSFIFLLMTILLYFSISETSAQQFQFPHTIKVTITALQAKSSDSCNGKMDFYGRMLIT